MEEDDELLQYILKHIDKEGDELARLKRDTSLYHLRPRMCSGHLQGRIIKMLVRMIRPHRVLEIGTFTGYSALCFAEGLPEGGEVHTIEIDDEIIDFTRRHIEASKYADKITIHLGDALDIIPTLGDEPWDLVFIDANKRHYLDYYNMVFPRVAVGGFILADNTLWDGKVEDPTTHHDPQTRGIIEFNDFIAADSRVEKVILPLRDGLTIIYKTKN